MAKKRKYKKRKKDFIDYFVLPSIPSFDLDPDVKRSIYILIMIILGALGILGIFNAAGIVGVYISLGLELAFGWGRLLIPLILIILGLILFNDERFEVRKSNYFGLIIFVISIETIMQLSVDRGFWDSSVSDGVGGGYLGLFIAQYSFNFLGIYASWITFVCLFIISLILTFNTSLSGLFGRRSLLAKLFLPFSFLIEKFANLKESREIKKIEKEAIKEDEEEESEEEIELDEVEEIEEDTDEPAESSFGTADESLARDSEEPQFNSKVIDAVPAIEKQAVKDALAEVNWWRNTGLTLEIPVSILSGGKEKPKSGDIKVNMETIRSTLENFHIPVTMGDVSVGPTVTQYTFKPSEGVKLAKITGLSNDLALALAAHPIRIEAPIPGKSLVGVEVPNEVKAVVTLRELLKSREYKERESNLMVALGEDVSGKPWLYDITKMPHLLVAGATNSGKSVCLNTMIVSLLYQNTPDELRFIMVDPKRVELPAYDGIPYLLTPVITDVDKTVNALKWCLKEMDRRYETLQKKHKKNIQSYNEVVKDKMPYIVFVIDELADLMVIAAKEIEAAIIRLAQMARAVGIHLILATQRPSVDVITGLIKANMPSRIAFSVASGTDSRTILDSLGAEKLLGRGDMLFATAEISKPVRIQGAYVSDEDIKKIIRIIKKRGGETKYVENVTDNHKVRGIGGPGSDFNGDGDSNGGDARLEEAKEIVINDQKASASYLQRKLSVGYARAAKLLDLLEEMGIVGASNGSKPREILVSREQYENMLSQGTAGTSLHSREDSVAPDNYLGEDEPATVLKSMDEDDEEEVEEEEDEEGEDNENNIESVEEDDVDDEEETEDEEDENDSAKSSFGTADESLENEEDDDSAKSSFGTADESLARDSDDLTEDENEDIDNEGLSEKSSKEKNFPVDKLFSK